VKYRNQGGYLQICTLSHESTQHHLPNPPRSPGQAATLAGSEGISVLTTDDVGDKPERKLVGHRPGVSFFVLELIFVPPGSFTFIASEKLPSQKKTIAFLTIIFQGRTVKLRGCDVVVWVQKFYSTFERLLKAKIFEVMSHRIHVYYLQIWMDQHFKSL